MLRNAEATRERILEAATAEFAARGIAGARVDRIAQAAGSNKNLIYVYFGDKEALFAAVLQRNVARIYEELPFNTADLAAYAMRVFDYARAHPEAMRLMAWYELEQNANPSERHPSIEDKLAALRSAQAANRIGAGFPAGFLLTAILSLATAWTAANPFGRAADPNSLDDPDALRRNIGEAVRCLVAISA